MDPVNELIATIYSAAADTSRWNDVVEGISRMFSHGTAIIYGHDSEARCSLGMVQRGLSPEQEQEFVSHYAFDSPFSHSLKDCPLGVPLRSLQLTSWEELSSSEYFNDFMIPRKSGAGVGIVLFREERRSLILTVDCDYRQREDIEPAIAAFVQSIAFHLQEAFKLMRRINGQDINLHVIKPMLELVKDPAYIVDARLSIVSCNRAGEQLVAQGAPARQIFGKLQLNTSSGHNRLEQSIHALARRRFGMFEPMFRTMTARGPLEIAVCPLDLGGSASADGLVSVFDERTPLACVTIKRGSSLKRPFAEFDLTASEAKLSSAIAAGEELRAYADRNQLSIHTVRNQLKSIFSKTGTRRQTELALLMQHHMKSSERATDIAQMVHDRLG